MLLVWRWFARQIANIIQFFQNLASFSKIQALKMILWGDLLPRLPPEKKILEKFWWLLVSVFVDLL